MGLSSAAVPEWSQEDIAEEVCKYDKVEEHSPLKMVVGRLLSYWEGNFSGAMLNFGEGKYTYNIYQIWCIYASGMMPEGILPSAVGG